MDSEVKPLQELVKHIDMAMWLIDRSTLRFLYVSPAFETIWGWPAERLYDDPGALINSIHPQDRERVLNTWRKDSREDHTLQYKIVKPDNSIRWIEEKGSVVQDAAGSVFHLAVVARDITATRRDQERLEFTNGRLQAIVDSTTAIISLKAMQGRYILVNRQFERVFAVDKTVALGKTDHELFPKDFADLLRGHDQQLLDSHETFEIEEQFPQRNGLLTYLSARFPIYDVDGFLYGLCTISTDITRRKQVESTLRETQQQLIQAAKMESVGRLAAGAAHEVKNPLAILLQGIGFLSTKIGTDAGELSTVFQDMNDAVRRADAVIKGLLDFSSPSRLVMALESLNGLIESTFLLVRNDLDRKHIRVIRELDKNLPFVTIDKNKIQQVLINILVNAIDAMPEGETLTVRTLTVMGTGHPNMACVEIDNQGVSMPPEILQHLFEPFVTTKQGRGGTGLGLSIVKNIMDTHQGAFDIRNLEAGGVRARLTFKPLERKVA